MFFTKEGISFPNDLDRELSQSLWAGSNGGELKQKRSQTLGRLWERLAKRRGMNEAGETHYSFQRPEADAYASYYLPANALKIALILEEAWLLGLDLLGNNCRWLDFGTGPGTAFWGLAWWANKRGKKIQFDGIDQSPIFAEIAGSLSKQRPFGAKANFLADRKLDTLTHVKKIGPTHVSFVNSVAEIFPDPEKRFQEMKKILGALAELSRKDGQARYLILIEPGSRESSRELAALKDRLQLEISARAILPCLDARPCGALVKPTDWCHEEVACEFPAWLNELGATAGLRKESILFSYATLRVDPEELLPGAFRVVSQRLERKGQVECFLCTPAGKIYARAQRSKADENSKAVLEASRGDIWQSAELGPKGDLLKAKLQPHSAETIF